jgi:hypothetical protein
MRGSVHRWIAALGGALLLALHLDFWRPQHSVLHFGWLPEELGYRIAWMLLAWLYLLHFTAYVWRDDEGQT